jgi:hypothetical protein
MAYFSIILLSTFLMLKGFIFKGLSFVNSI